MSTKVEQTVYIDIKFWTMVVLMIKFAIAVIPATIILVTFWMIMLGTLPGIAELLKAATAT